MNKEKENKCCETQNETEKKDEKCCEEGSKCCCNVSRSEVSGFLRHIADFFDRKK